MAFLALAAALAAGAAPAETTRTATLRIVDRTPVTVRGAGFRAGERVSVVLRAKRRYVRTVRAGAGGSFVMRFALYADLCTAFNLRAAGNSGAVAYIARKLPPQCAPLDSGIG